MYLLPLSLGTLQLEYKTHGWHSRLASSHIRQSALPPAWALELEEEAEETVEEGLIEPSL